VRYEEREGTKFFEEGGWGEDDAAVCRREFAGEVGLEGEEEWTCTVGER
jgi:hypothetical protein